MTCACRHYRTGDLDPRPMCYHPDMGPGEGWNAGEMGCRVLAWLADRKGECPGREAPDAKEVR